jgi:hypothetical protein
LTGAPSTAVVLRVGTRLLCVLLLLVSTASLLAASRWFGGVDSYYFFLYGDDLTKSAAETSYARYFYFPGAYALWRAVAMVAGRDFAWYQRAFVCVSLANAALTGLVVQAAGGGLLLAAASFCGYLLLGQRMQLAEMTTEPLVTLAPLFGLWFWLMCERRGKSRLALACLGACYGLAVFVKQQGAFLVLGVVGLAPHLWRRSRPWHRGLSDMGTIVTTALVAFASAMELDGGGMAAVKYGLSTAAAYESQGSFIAHLTELLLRSPALLAAVVATCLWPVAFLLSRDRPSSGARLLLTVWATSGVTASITFLQFSRRNYPHYALLTLPFALMAIAMALRWSWEEARPSIATAEGAVNAPRRAAPGMCGLAVLGVLLAKQVWNPAVGHAATLPHESYAPICKGIESGRRLLLLPSRENALHWACGTHARGTKWGYTFNFQERPEEYIDELKPELSQVFVFRNDRGASYEHEVFARHDWSGFFESLAREGFRPVVDTQRGTLYRRTPGNSRTIMTLILVQ